MGVPNSEVVYTIATTRRETTKVHKNMWWHWGKKSMGRREMCLFGELKGKRRLAKQGIHCMILKKTLN